MTSQPQPLTPAQQEKGPPAGETAAPPSAPGSAAGSDSRRGGMGLDRVLTILVLALAFLAASFPARNSDLWFHLATGRLLAGGDFSFGTDPFAYTTGEVYWVCHSWLFDLTLYGLCNLIGGAGLVVLKALLVTALAGLMLRVRRADAGAGLPALCAALAVLAMSPRLLLQPACASYFLLGLTFWLLWRPHREKEETKTSGFRFHTFVALIMVFALWVNVDEWFLLGPALVALFWLGERLGGARRTPGWVVPAGLAACLLNPFTFRAFTLPAEWSPVTWTSGLRHDARFQAVFASPWQPGYLQAAAEGNASALAYYALTFLGLASFALHRPAVCGWRLTVWLPFALLAAWQARAIPFFAVVAAPITALNGQDFLAARQLAPAPGRGRWGFAGRLLLAPALLALLALTTVGRLAGYDRTERHVGWGIQADPALQQVTETLHEWRSRGLLAPGERTFALAPEVAQYSAWFCPEEKYFFDHRYHLFPLAGRDYEAVCRALEPGPETPAAPAGGEDGFRVLRERGIAVVVYYDREPQRLFAVLRRLAGAPEHWTLLQVAGQAMMVGRNEARPRGGFAPLTFDADRLAFVPPDGGARRALPAAPEQGPEQLPPRRDFWARLTRPPAPPSWESAAATVYLHYFYDREMADREQQSRSCWGGYAASLVGLPAQPAAVAQAVFQLHSSRELLFPKEAEPRFLVREQFGPFLAPLGERSPALPLLAIRAARRAVAANPEDANAWLRLGQAYLLLRNTSRERDSLGLPPLAQLRHVQIVTALEQALRLDPALEAAHHELAFLYGARHFLDQALEHRREEVRLSRKAGRRANETAEEFTERLDLLEKDTAKLVALVEDHRKTYVRASATLQGDRLAQADLALKLGLARLAAEEVLLSSPADLLRPAGIRLEVDLLLSLGRAQEVRSVLADKGLRASKNAMGYYDLLAPKNPGGAALYALPYHWPAYEWLHLLGAAAVGDYAAAREDLTVTRAELRAGHLRLRQRPRDLQRQAWMLWPGLLSSPPLLPAFTARALAEVHQQGTAAEAGERALRAQQADLAVLEGLLALEQGDPSAARAAFAEALEVAAAEWFAGRPVAAGCLGRLHPH